MGSKRLVLPVRLNYDDEARRWYVMSAPVSSVVAECYSRSDADAVIAALNSNAERDRLATLLREREAELAEEREARNRIARENADRIGRAVDADKAAVVEFARVVLADRDWYCHDHGLDDAPLVREMAEQIEEGNSRGLIDVVMNALREAQAATRRECAAELRDKAEKLRKRTADTGAWEWAARVLEGFASRWERGPAEPATRQRRRRE